MKTFIIIMWYNCKILMFYL